MEFYGFYGRIYSLGLSTLDSGYYVIILNMLLVPQGLSEVLSQKGLEGPIPGLK